MRVVTGACIAWVVVVAAVLVMIVRAGRGEDPQPEPTWADPADRWVCGCPVGVRLHVCAYAADGRLAEIAVIEAFEKQFREGR